MRIILTPVGSSGDVFPFLGIGTRLRERGHDVVVVTAEPFRSVAVRAGLGFEPHQTAEEFYQITGDPALWHPTRGLRIILGAMAEGIDGAYAALQRVYQPGSLLVGHTLSWVTRAFEELHDTRAVTVHLAPSVFRSRHELPAAIPGVHLPGFPQFGRRAFWWTIDRWFVDPHIAAPFNTWRTRIGLPPVSRPLNGWIHSPRRTLGLFPDWFHPPPADWPAQLRLTQFPLFDDGGVGINPALERFLAWGSPPVLFAAGSANRQAASFYRSAVDATARLGLRAILQTAFPEQLPDPMPTHAHHVPFAPFSAVLPRCAAIVHHAGIGTCAQGLAAGIPQLAVPLAFDQPDNTGHLLRLGVADWIHPTRLHPRRLARKLGRLLDSPRVGASCRRWQARLAAVDPLVETCELIEATAQ